jgi:magnesium transporter
MGFTFARFYVSTADAAVVAGTVALVVTFGTVNGTLLPIVLKRIGMDPALMSNPLIASLSDMVGVLIYYNVALLALGG